jgi:hypothetical protein
MKHAAYRIYRFYRDGFASMKLGKKLWLLIAIKLFILFAVVKYFFFPNILKENFQTDQQRSDYILKQLTQGEM